MADVKVALSTERSFMLTRPTHIGVKLGKDVKEYPVNDYSEKIGSFCDGFLKKQFNGNIPGEYDIEIGREVHDRDMVLDLVWEAVVQSGHMDIVLRSPIDAHMGTSSAVVSSAIEGDPSSSWGHVGISSGRSRHLQVASGAGVEGPKKEAKHVSKQLLTEGKEAAKDPKTWNMSYKYLKLAHEGGCDEALPVLNLLFSDMYDSLKSSFPSKLSDNQGSALSVLTEAGTNGKYSSAQMYLGQCFEYGYGVHVDEECAAEKYLDAASQGISEAMFKYAQMYLYGKGMQKNTAKAKSWMSTAAWTGHKEAQNWLEMMNAAYSAPVVFNFDIKNWKEKSQSRDDIPSRAFTAHEAQWKLIMKPGTRCALHLYLVDNQDLPSDWWVEHTKLVHYTLTVVNQTDESQTRAFERYHCFKPSDRKDGVWNHTPLSVLRRVGYVVNDTVIVQVMVRVKN